MESFKDDSYFLAMLANWSLRKRLRNTTAFDAKLSTNDHHES
jgi:hypothetical protein